MKRVMFAAVSVCFLALAAHAQTSTTSDTVADRTPLSNVRAGNLAKRAPGSWIRAALDRHSGAATSSSSANTSSATTNSTSSTSSSTGLGGLDSLLGLLGGSSGSTSSTSGLSSLLSLFGGSSGLLGGSAKSINDTMGDSATTGKSATAPSQGTSFLDILQQFAVNNGSSAAAKTDSRSQSTTTTDDRKFWKRWADAMLQTTFLGISQAMQSQAFINNVKDMLRPFFTSPSAADTTTDGTNNTDGTGGDGGTGGSGQI